jgi:hypothetical protein
VCAAAPRRLGRHSGRVCEQQLSAPSLPADDCEAVAALEPRGVELEGAEERCRAQPSCRGQGIVGVELEAVGGDEGGGVRLRRNIVELAEPARPRVGPQLGRAPFSLNPVSLSVERPFLSPDRPLRGCLANLETQSVNTGPGGGARSTGRVATPARC